MTGTPDWDVDAIYVDGSPVAVYTTGDPAARPLVFLHGWGLSPRSYMPLLTRIADHGNLVVAPALPGFGGSAPLDDSARDTLPRMAARITAALEETGIETAVPFVGHSLGAGVTIHIAGDQPRLVAGTLLICPIGGAGSHVTTWLHLAGGLRHEMNNRPLARALDAVPTFLRHPHTAATAGIAAKHADLTGHLSSLAARGIPVEIVTADHDGVLPTHRLTGLPGVPVVEVHGSHGWPLADPAGCSALVDRFTSRLRP